MNTAVSPTPTLDIRAVAVPDARAALLSAFDALAPGQALTLVSSDHAGRLLLVLQAERKGLFEWSPVDEDPSAWHVEIQRRDASPGALRGVTEALAWDHDRLDALEQRAFAALHGGDSATARRLFAVFARGLNRHIGFEEELLFPAFEERSGMGNVGPTAVMRAEHRQIRMLLEEIARNLDGSPSVAEELRLDLHRVLGEHNAKEEQILYPMTDRFLDAAESDALVARIQAFAS